MPRPRTGSVFPHGDHFDIQVTLPNGQRSRRMCQEPSMSEAKAREKALVASQLAAKEGIGVVPTRTAKGVTPPPSETFEAWAERWCKAREERGLTSVNDDRGRLRKWVLPLWRDKPIAGLERADVEALVEDLDVRVRADELSWKTATNVWGLVTKALADACKSKVRALRVRDTNPAADVEGPDRGAKKSKVYLYPSEFLRLVACEEVPLRWRRIFTLATYLYLRAGEERGLEWPDLDLEHLDAFVHRTVDDDGKVDTTKGEQSRHVQIEAELVPLLEAMRAEAGQGRRVIERMPPEEDLAEKLRHWLRKAGVTREELFVNDRSRKWMTFHDLRATGITWRAIRGDEPLRIMRAAGHKNFQTTLGYIRAAEQVRDGFGTVFPPLPPSLLGRTPGAPGQGGESPPETLRSRSKNRQPLGMTHRNVAIPAGIEPALPA